MFHNGQTNPERVYTSTKISLGLFVLVQGVRNFLYFIFQPCFCYLFCLHSRQYYFEHVSSSFKCIVSRITFPSLAPFCSFSILIPSFLLSTDRQSIVMRFLFALVTISQLSHVLFRQPCSPSFSQVYHKLFFITSLSQVC